MVLLTGQDPVVIVQLAERIAREVPGARITGVLHEPWAPRGVSHRIRTFLRNLGEPGFLPYAGSRIVAGLQGLLIDAGHRLLRVLHAAPLQPNGSGHLDLPGLELWLAAHGARLHVTRDMHSPAALQFVKELRPDLGIVFGTRILKPELFEIPRLGSINIHKRKVPDYRGGGDIGLWELLDGQKELGVTVHRVAVKLDAGDIVRSAVIPIEPLDTLESLGLKADVVGIDLLVQATADFAAGTARPVPQQGTGRMFRTPKPWQLRRHRQQIERMRPQRPYPAKRPLWKLLARVAVLGPRAALRNRAYRRRAAFPVVIFYHHVVADRPHSMGTSTDLFRRQVRYLRRHYRIASLAEALEMLRAGRVEAPTVVLTFDDGYADNYLNVRAVTEPLGLSATFFVCSEHIETGRPFAHDLKAGDLSFAPFTWDQVRTLRRHGYLIASHTRTHFDCGSTDEARLRHEIVDARREIEAELGEPVPWFSFPWGHPQQMSSVAVQIARSHYDFVFSACGGTNPPDPGNVRWHLRRISHPGNLLELELSLQSLLELHPAGERLSF